MVSGLQTEEAAQTVSAVNYGRIMRVQPECESGSSPREVS